MRNIMVQNEIQKAIQEHQLPQNFITTVTRWYRPLANQVAEFLGHYSGTAIIGVQGTQGSGKSTLADFLKLLLWQDHKRIAVAVSIDDFYLTHDQRRRLADSVHPLFATRGVPGTHDVPLAMTTLARLRDLGPSEIATVPRFNKALDDRAPESAWDKVSGPVDAIIFEGWCLGAPPQTPETLAEPLNNLEAEEDKDGRWRRHVNSLLQSDYAKLFAMIDKLIVLNAPSFDCVFRWRLLQEQKLAEKWRDKNPTQASRILNPAEVKHFISHYQRLTEHCLTVLPNKADWLLQLDEDHTIVSMHSGKPHD